jgi:coproporphyrinogen III oxidase
MALTKEEIAAYFKELQVSICDQLEAVDGNGKFRSDRWERPGGGGGDSRIIENGNIIEKGGVNFSAVHGPTPENILNALELDKADFFATGVSIVQHPHNPWVPIIHMNIRYFEMSSGAWWFGGGMDLTPHFIDDAQAAWFHRQLKDICDHHDVTYYPAFKKWADDYFFLKHRDETRGVGGIFFDRLGADKDTKEQLFDFVKAVGELFAPVYTQLMKLNANKPFGEKEKIWQHLRRGRYVEFNLVWDKGTRFGLDTNGRTESILMSLPPQANWQYNYRPEKRSRESATLEKLKKGIDWLNKK